MVLLTIDLTAQLIAATILVFASGIMAALGGVGGAALFIPILLICGQVPEFAAIPLSMSAVFGGAVAMNMYTVRAKQEDGERPLINYQVALTLFPSLLLGSVFGVRLNKIFPFYIISVLLAGLLAFTTYKTYQSGKKLRRKEIKYAKITAGRALDEPLLASDISTHEVNNPMFRKALISTPIKHEPRLLPAGLDGDGLLSHSFDAFQRIVERDRARTIAATGPYATLPSNPDANADVLWSSNYNMQEIDAPTNLTEPTQNDDSNSNDSADLQESNEDKMLRAQLKEAQYPLGVYFVLGLCWAYVLAINIVVEANIGIECGSSLFWLILCSSFLALGLVTLFAGRWHVKHSKQMKDIRSKLALNDKSESDQSGTIEAAMEWNVPNTVYIVLASFLSGLISAMLGVGGSTIQGPLLLFVLKNPHHSSATSGLLLLLTSSSSMVQYASLDRLPLYPAAVFVVIGLISGILGHYFLELLLRRYQSLSFITFFLAAYIGAGCVAMTVLSVIKAYADLSEGNYGFRPLCS